MKFSLFKVLNLYNAVLLFVAFIQYLLLKPLNVPSEKYIDTLTEFDFKIELIPVFIIPYISVYVLLLVLIFILIKKTNAFELSKFLLSVVVLFSIINLLHGYLFTADFIRPQEIKGTGFFSNSIKALYESVNPFRTLPNWHAATAVLCAFVYAKMKFEKLYIIITWAALICLSPLFLKMAYIADVLAAIPLPFLCYVISEKISVMKFKTEVVQEVIKTFTTESLIQSVAIGFRDETTISNLIDGLTRIEKSLTDKDLDEIKSTGAELEPKIDSLKQVINNLILSISVENQIEKTREKFPGEKNYDPSDYELKQTTEELINAACVPFENQKFRNLIQDIKKRNSEKMNNAAIEEAALERSKNIISKFTGFIDSHKNDIDALKIIYSGVNGHSRISFEDVKILSRELRKPPFEITPEEIWNAYYRVDKEKVKPMGEHRNPTNIISLAKFAAGKIEKLEPFSDKIETNFEQWLNGNTRKFTPEEIQWLNMMKSYAGSFLEINMLSFNDPPFVSKGGADKAYKLFGPDLNRILLELNEKLFE